MNHQVRYLSSTLLFFRFVGTLTDRNRGEGRRDPAEVAAALLLKACAASGPPLMAFIFWLSQLDHT